MSLKIVYDDKAETLEFIKDDFSVCTAGVAAFNSVYSKNFSRLQTAFLPPAIRQIARYGDKTFIFYEERPQYHQVQFTPEKLESLTLDSEGAYNYYLPFPWLMFVIELSPGNDITNIHGFIQKPKKKFLDRELYQMPIHNWYSNNLLCRPMYNSESIVKHVDLLSVINQVHAEIWTSGFNNDLRDTIDNYVLRIGDFGDKSFLDSAQRKTLLMLRNGDRELFYNFYYTAWANTPMEKMMKASYNSVGTIATTFGHVFETSETVIDRNQFASELLMAAQYASFIK